jgi:glutathione S-transferase
VQVSWCSRRSAEGSAAISSRALNWVRPLLKSAPGQTLLRRLANRASGPGWLLRRHGSAFRNSTPGLKSRALPGSEPYEQIPALAERGRARIQHFFSWLDAWLSDNEFICDPHFTIADITGMVTVDFCGWTKLTAPEHLTHLRRWHSAGSARPSAKA